MMKRTSAGLSAALLAAACGAALVGCGSTRTSNTLRTATEQLLVSDAIDRTVEQLDFSPLRGQSAFLDETRLLETVDRSYLISSLRQHLLASGVILKQTREEATFVLEPRSGGVGTDDHDLLFGIPALQVPQVPLAPTLPAAIPEIPFAKRRDQRGVAKVAVFAYRRDTGEPVFQTGLVSNESTANDIWVFGAGPFKRGTIYDRAKLAQERKARRPEGADPIATLDDEAVFAGLKPESQLPIKVDPGVQQASATEPVKPLPSGPPSQVTPHTQQSDLPAAPLPPPTQARP